MSFFFVTEKSKMPSSATGVGMPICLLGGVLLILTQKNSQKFGDVLGIMRLMLGCYKLQLVYDTILFQYFKTGSHKIKHLAIAHISQSLKVIPIIPILLPFSILVS